MQWTIGGCLAHFATNWEKISNNPWVQETISGSRLEFWCIPEHGSRPGRMHLDAKKSQVLSQEVKNLAAKEAIQSVLEDREGLYQSDIPCSKVKTAHGACDKLEITEQVCGYSPFQNGINQDSKRVNAEGRLARLKKTYILLSPSLFTPKISQIPMAEPDVGIQSPPIGLNSPPYTSKLMKLVVSTLRKLGIRSILYLDDMLIMARNKEEARRHLATAMELLVALGFIINLKKSTLTPTQELEFLGFLLSSHNMTTGLSTHKLHALQKMVIETNGRPEEDNTTGTSLHSWDDGSGSSGNPTSSSPLQTYRECQVKGTSEWLYIRVVIHTSGYTYEWPYIRGRFGYRSQHEADLEWWLSNSSQHNGRPLQIGQWDLTIKSDASHCKKKLVIFTTEWLPW